MLLCPSDEEFGFFIGPLKRIDPLKVARRLFRLLECVGIKCSDIATISVSQEKGFATVRLFSAAVEDYAIKAFREVRSVMDLYDLRRLTEKPQNLKVERVNWHEAPECFEVADMERTKTKTGRVHQINRKTCSATNQKEADTVNSVLLKSAVRSGKKHPSAKTDSDPIAFAADPLLRAPLTWPNPGVKSVEALQLDVHDLLSLSRTSSSSPSPAGFEELEEEDLEDYAEGIVFRGKQETRTRSMQTSEKSSSSSDAIGASSSTASDALSKVASRVLSVSRSALDNNIGQDTVELLKNSGKLTWHSVPQLSSGASGIEFQASADLDTKHLNKSSTSSFDNLKAHSKADQKALLPNLDTAAARMGNSNSAVNQTFTTQPIGNNELGTHNTERPEHRDATSDDFIPTNQNGPRMIHAKTSTHRVEPSFCSGPSFYHQGEKLNVEGRNVYLDHGYIVNSDLRTFRSLLGCHVCAFLNSGGGTLFFGVNPSGATVKGLPVSHKYEDALRLDIDRQIKLITPLVPTSFYKVNFVKIMSETGHLIPDVRMLEIEVMPPDHTLSSSSTAFRPRDQGVNEEEEEESSSSWPSAEEGYKFKDVRYVWDGGRVKISG